MKLTRPVESGVPTAMDVVAIRCGEHSNVPPLNQNENSGAECGICAAVAMTERAVLQIQHEELLAVLDGYAMRLTHHAVLRSKIAVARQRLDMIAPGAGDFLSEEDDDAARDDA